MIILKSPWELARMRQAGQIVAKVLAALREEIRPGVTTAHLDALAYQIIAEHKAIPSFKGYRGFPASLCASINEEVVHGIPGPRTLEEGDIISLDVGAIYQGYHGDAAITVGVGRISQEAARLLEVTVGALEAGIAQARPGHRLWDVIRAIQGYVEERGFNVVREYQGHGIGREMHEEPSIPNFLGDADQRPRNVRLRPGMTFALEPMVVAGDWPTRVLGNKWTVVTKDRRLSAHFEHTIAVTEDGPEILTRLREG
ncbi:MAG: type I methionyl aminopeptidase [Anaerolineae bacterium]